LEDQCVITRQVTVAGGVFAPGHLGELTQIVPFEMVDQALAATGTTQARVRVLPSRVVVYLLLAGGLFAELGYRQVWHKLTAGLGQLPVAQPSDNALWQARARLGAAPLRWLFDLLRGPATAIIAGPVRWGGLLVCAIDGTTMTIPDSPRNLAAYGKQAGNHGGPGYPQLRLVARAACGTRTLLDAVFGPASTSEQDYTRRLRRSLHPGMIVLLDRNFDAAALIGQLAATGADLLVRLRSNRKLPVLRRYHDGSFLSQIGAVRVRVTECQITIATSAGRHTGAYRLATTLLDPRRYPAAGLISLYHQRWVRHEVAWSEWNSRKEDRLMSVT
jgi:Insertion element 4 transposase N-terminal/Transposase DDE domain